MKRMRWFVAILFVLGWALLAVVASRGALVNLVWSKPADSGVGPQEAALGRQLPLVRVLGDPQRSGLKGWTPMFDNQPGLFDINGDGVDEVIGNGNDTNVYVFNVVNGKVVAVLPTIYPDGWYNERVLNVLEAAPLRPGEPPSIVVGNGAAYITAWRYNPSGSTSDHFRFDKLWEHRMNACFWNPGMDATPVLADLDGDGTKEILVNTEENGFYALHADGSTFWKFCWDGGNASPVVGDLDGDRRPEVVFASDSGLVSVIDGASGRAEWTFNAADHGVFPASISVAPTIADIDGVSPAEILFTTRNAPSADPAEFPKHHVGIFAIHQNLQTGKAEILWTRQPDWAYPLSYTRLQVADVDGDGRMDIFGLDWNTIGHFPGNWENLGTRSHVFRLDADGHDVWVKDVDAWWSNKDIAVGDVYVDGHQDVLVEGPRHGIDGLWVLSAETGKEKAFLPAGQGSGMSHPWKLLRGPLLADLRHDGSRQLLYPVIPDETLNGADTRGAILVFDLDPDHAKTWT